MGYGFSDAERDYQGRVEECGTCSNKGHLDCGYSSTNIPGKCNNFNIDGLDFHALFFQQN
ncbi:hypothetical protein CL621_03405 [archaeon]|nr:hypothetical protein [archaeon]|tara:strand:+ start:245 stop:424 length:180 start_codon:yes stop_codon:yes gene_type:complete